MPVTMSRDQLVLRAHSVLGLAMVGQTPAQDDLDVIDALVEPTIDRLNALGITSNTDLFGVVTQLDDPEAIPSAQFMDVAILLADALKQDFGLAALPQNNPAESEIRLRTILSTGPTMENYESTVTDLTTDVETDVTYQQPETLYGEYF